ncbi:hypothetical protein ULF88_04980 [Halopseudomonas pachastrellae]|nr:hypothetical protein [Halopseudomonas pachastrellae]
MALSGQCGSCADRRTATHDSDFPASSQQEPAGQTHLPGNWHLPDWDGDASNDTSGASLQDPGSTFYLDDMAAFARALDLRQGGVDAAGQSWDDPAYPAQNLRTYTLGFALMTRVCALRRRLAVAATSALLTPAGCPMRWGTLWGRLVRIAALFRQRRWTARP